MIQYQEHLVSIVTYNSVMTSFEDTTFKFMNSSVSLCVLTRTEVAIKIFSLARQTEYEYGERGEEVGTI